MEKISLVDVHAHLDDVEDLPESLRQANQAGVRAVVAVGVDIESNKKILKIARENRGYVYPAIGYHPWQMSETGMEENLSFVRDHIHECVAFGEVGLDYKVKVKKELQWKAFGTLLHMAYESGKPVIVHCRFSHQRALEMIVEAKIEKAIFHWYSGSLHLLGRILARDYFISATPALVYSPPHQEAIKHAPLERILLETDSPVSYQGKEARPKDVRVALEEVARLKGVDPLIVASQTTTNASQFFQIPL